jgi:hypothetical protein
VHFGGNFKGLNICKTMQCHFISFLKKMKRCNLEILPNGKKIPFFLFCYKFYLIIKKIKAKFIVGTIIKGVPLRQVISLDFE